MVLAATMFSPKRPICNLQFDNNQKLSFFLVMSSDMDLHQVTVLSFQWPLETQKIDLSLEGNLLHFQQDGQLIIMNFHYAKFR